jgi:hypothetical protein
MKHLIILLLLVTSIASLAQNCTFSGSIVDSEGNAIPFTSVYIASIANGSMANIDGDFSITAPCSIYTIQFQSLGFEKKALKIDFSKNLEQIITLKSIAYDLGEVEVDASQEDIAYSYIRKATAMAEYYKKQITAYECELYIRSFYDPEKIPWLAKKLISEEDLADMATGNISETLLEYSFKRPNTVNQKILAAKSGILDSLKDGAQYINLNFYNLGGPSIINPLSKNAFAVYEFEHVSTYYEDLKGIHKIKIIPRRNGNDLMSGYIYINDKVWNINNVDVEFEQPLAKLKYQQLYAQVRPNVWMPINHKITADVQILGYEVQIKYLSTLSKLKVTTNPKIDQQILNSLQMTPEDIHFDGTVPVEKKIKLEKLDAKIEKIITQDRVSKGESLKLIRLIKQKERQLEEKNDTIDDLEITANRSVTYADSVFSQTDSIWNTHRTIPLSEQEHSIYMERDSLQKIIKGDTAVAKKRSLIGHLLFYDTPQFSKDKKFRFTPYGLLSHTTGEFNTVNGVTPYKTLFKAVWLDKKGKLFRFEPMVGYAFSRNRFLGDGQLKAQYDGQRRASFFAHFGRLADDFNREESIPLLVNTISSLFYTQNSKKFYESDFFKIGHQIDIANGLQLITTFDFEDRSALQNNSDFTLTDWWGSKYTTNLPENNEVNNNKTLLDNHQSSSIDVELNYTPKQFYRVKNGTKEMLRSKFPTFVANYRQGLNDVLSSDANYQFVSFAVKQELPVRRIDRFTYHLEAGSFLQSNSTFFADYKNFNSSPLLFLSNDLGNSFKLLENYRFSTNERYFEAHFRVEDNRILLKRIPFFSTKGISETINVNYLVTEQNINYTEVGYSIDRIFFGMKVGVYAAFEDDEFAACNVRIGFGGFLNR